ncbi:hypothetical protein CBM2637_A150041 [Cupriavidus taiwanensis]|uniref:hypothetical protein n=1 Tax=Cupriavidus taiwanensis TaxID=164546 RepID=UPI000E1AA255|nr:hypothetical protein [Cupriavidus taiwanensis]SPA24588.1 hypothetical protein CBM2637_A150041 [Cupriavidus taiwanensis]
MLTIVQGRNFSKVGAVISDGQATDCTGWGVRAYLRYPADGTTFVELDAAFQDAEKGVFTLDNPAPTTGYPLGRLTLLAELISPAGKSYYTLPEPVQVIKE